jgi:hypothetical protein
MAFRNSFSIRKTKPRKFVSRSPLKLPAEELAHELGPRYQTIDARIGHQKLVYDFEQGEWTFGSFVSIYVIFLFIVYLDGTVGTSVSSREIVKLEKTKRELEVDNNVFHAKLDMLLEMLAEVTGEYEVRRGG